jgi:hypothetical protein
MGFMSTDVCLITDCGRPSWVRGWCSMHYQRWQDHGDPLKTVKESAAGRTCTREGCEKPVYAKGICKSCYSKDAYKRDPSKAIARAERYAEQNPEQVRAAARERYARNPEAAVARTKQWRQENPERVRESQRERNRRHPGRSAAYQKKHRGKHGRRLNAKARANYAADPEKFRAANRAWAAAHPDMVRLWSRARTQRCRRQTPPWADQAAILAVYEACLPGQHVDHEIPLKAFDRETGLYVASGLHVAENLRHLDGIENIRRKNYWSPEYTDLRRLHIAIAS